MKVTKELLGIGVALSLFMAVFLGAGQSWAEESKKNTTVLRPVGCINSSNGSVFGVGKYGVILRSYHWEQKDWYRGSDSIDWTPPDKGTPGAKLRKKELHEYRAVLRTGIYKDFDLRIIVPLRDREMTLARANGTTFTRDSTELGDIKALSRYRVMSQQKGDFANVAAGIGISMPTGSNDESDSYGVQPAFLQGGTNSWDPIFELGAHKIMGRHLVSLYSQYKLSTEGEVGSNDFETPDVFRLNMGYSFAALSWIDLTMELNHYSQSRARLNGKDVVNSGGDFGYITPGINLKFTKNMFLSVGVPIIIYRDLNGMQPFEDYRVVTKLAFNF